MNSNKFIFDSSTWRLAVGVLLTLLAAPPVFAQTAYYWVGRDWASGSAFGAYWNYNNNWSTSSGGSGLGSPLPSAQNYLNFDGNMVAPANGLYNITNNAYTSGFQIFFKSTIPAAINLYGTNSTGQAPGLAFFDFSSVDPNIQNEGTTYTPTINFGITNSNTHVSGSTRILNINQNSSPARGPLTFNGPITTPNDSLARVINIGGGNVTFNGVISDGGASSAQGLTLLGSGTVTLNAANTYNGQTTISAGTVSNTVSTGFGTGTVAIGAAGTAIVTLGSDQNVNNVFTGTGNLTVSGSTGTPNFNNASALNGFTGTLNVNTSAGKKLSMTTAGQNFGSGATVNIASGGTLYYNPLNATVNSVTFNLAGAGNTESLGALRIENGVTIGSSSSIVASGNTQLGGNGNPTTINAVISETGGSRSVEKVGSGTMTFGGNNSYNGATILTGGTLSISTDSAGAYNLGGTTGNNGITFNGGTLQVTGTAMTSFGSHTPTFTATKTVNLDIANAANNFTISQALNQTTGGLTKTGAGTLTLSGANNYTGGTRANAGTLVLSGSHTKAAGTTDFLSVNNVGAQNAVLKITAGTHGFTDFNIAEVANARAAVYQSGGDWSNGTTGGIGIKIGSGSTTYAYYNLSGGTVTLQQALDFQVGGGSGATGLMDMSGGSVTAASWVVLGRNGAGNGLLNVTGGSFTSQANNIALNWANTAGSISILNVGGGAGTASVTGNNSASSGLSLSESTTAGTTAVANLLSNGTLTVGKVYASQAASTALLNFNGGTLKATAVNAGGNFMNSANMDAVTVYSGGGKIDNNGTSITIGNVLGAATDTGVSSISGPSTQGSGYIGAPLVTITGGTGSGATAYAVMADDGTGNGTYKVSSIVVTSPGIYTVAPTTVTLTGGGAGTAATGFTINTSANTSGGMTFQGTGTTTILPGNTYTGGTAITNCTVNADANNTTTSTHFGTGNVVVNGNGTSGKVVLGSGSTTGVNNSTVTRANNFALTNAFLYVQDQKHVLSGTLAIGGAGATLGSTYNNAGAETDKGLILNGVVSGSGPITVQHTRIATGSAFHVGFVAFNNNANTYSGTLTINENTTTSEGGVYVGIYQPNALANAAVVANNDVPGSNLKFGNSPIVFNAGIGSASIGSISGSAKLVLTEYNASTHAYGANPVALTVGGNNSSTTYSGVISGLGTLTKTGSGTMTLTGVNTFTNGTIISGGKLALSGSGAISNSVSITVSNGATFDVSAVSYALAAGQTLRGSGVVTGNVATASSAANIAPGASAGTLTFSNNLDLSAGSTLTFELSTNYNSGNDQIIVGGNLTLSSSDIIHISALGGAANLDTNSDYVLFSVAGTTTMATSPTVIWDGTTPANYLNYSLVQTNNNVVLRYSAASAPTLTASVTPAPAARNQPFTVTAVVTNGIGGGSVVSVTVDLTQVGGSASSSLVLSNNNVWTNTFAVSAGTATGAKSFTVSATDNTSPTPLVGTYIITSFSVTATNQVWAGAGANDNLTTGLNWTSGFAPGLVGDSLTFAGTTRLTPNMDTNYTITGVTFDGTAGGFNIGTASGNTLTFVSGGITNNSANAQTLNIPIAKSGNLLTVTGATDVVIQKAITGTGSLFKQGAGTLTISSNSFFDSAQASSGGFSGPLISQAGTLVFNNGGSNQVNGELVIGGVIANGGAGNNAKVIVDNAILNLSSWLSVGRGNGVGGVSSDLVLSNGASLSAPNVSCGYNGNNSANLPKGSVTMYQSSIFTVTGNGSFFVGESAGSAMTMTLSNSASLVASGTGAHRIGGGGNGVLNVSDSSTVNFGSFGLDVGYVTGNGTVNLNGGTISTTGSGVTAIARSTAPTNSESGTFNVNGGTFNSAGDLVVGLGGTNAGTLTINGGTVNVGTAATRWLIIGQFDTVQGQLNITNGNLNLWTNTCIRFTSAGGGGTNAVNQSGGTVTFYSDNALTVGGAGVLDLAQAGAATARNTYNLDGGTLIVPQVLSATNTPTRIFNFNGGTLKSATSTGAFFYLGTGNAVANVRNGGAIIDTTNLNVTVGQALVHSTVVGDNATDGGLAKNGSGTLTLTNQSTYTGNTTINAGALALTGTGSIGSSARIVIAAGATFDVSGLSSTFVLNSGQTLTNISGTGVIAGNANLASGALALNYTNGMPALNVTNGTLNFNNNAVSVNVAGTLPHGIYKLISTNAGGQVTGTLPSSITINNIGSATGTLSLVNGEVYLTVNHPPVAGNASYTRNAGISNLRIVVSDLLTNVTDADGDSIVLVSLGNSTNGITPIVVGGFIGYYNTNNVDDQFSYTVTDGFGGTNSGTIRVTLNNAVITGQMTGSFTSFTNGVASLAFHGIPNYSYILERSTNLTDWVNVQTNAASTNGVLNLTDQFNDLGGVPPSSAYYRLKWQP